MNAQKHEKGETTLAESPHFRPFVIQKSARLAKMLTGSRTNVICVGIGNREKLQDDT